MPEQWEIITEYTVEIWFRIEKGSDGYPRSKSWEQLLAHPVTARDDYFEIASIPFFLKNVSRGDIVKATTVVETEVQNDEIFEFDSIIERGGHNTYRLLVKKEDSGGTVKELQARGLAVEEESGGLLAVDVPPSVNQRAVDSFLVKESESGRWQMQDGFLYTIKTH